MVTNPLSCGYNLKKNNIITKCTGNRDDDHLPRPPKNIKIPRCFFKSNISSMILFISLTALERGCFPVLFRVDGFLSEDLNHLNLTTSPDFSKTPVALRGTALMVYYEVTVGNHT